MQGLSSLPPVLVGCRDEGSKPDTRGSIDSDCPNVCLPGLPATSLSVVIPPENPACP
jgi:hypothetical protein